MIISKRSLTSLFLCVFLSVDVILNTDGDGEAVSDVVMSRSPSLHRRNSEMSVSERSLVDEANSKWGVGLGTPMIAYKTPETRRNYQTPIDHDMVLGCFYFLEYSVRYAVDSVCVRDSSPAQKTPVGGPVRARPTANRPSTDEM